MSVEINVFLLSPILIHPHILKVKYLYGALKTLPMFSNNFEIWDILSTSSIGVRCLVFIPTGYKVLFNSLNFALINPATTLL